MHHLATARNVRHALPPIGALCLALFACPSLFAQTRSVIAVTATVVAEAPQAALTQPAQARLTLSGIGETPAAHEELGGLVTVRTVVDRQPARRRATVTVEYGAN